MFFFEEGIILLMYKDPVCNMIIDGRRNVYLCSAACKGEFEKNSSKYGYLNTTDPKSQSNEFQRYALKSGLMY
jgi:YHS domain-containing protein